LYKTLLRKKTSTSPLFRLTHPGSFQQEVDCHVTGSDQSCESESLGR